MAADHIQFLKNKFINEFQEAGTKFDKLPLHRNFQEISEVLGNTPIADSTPIEMKDWLYDLKYALAECVMLVEKEEKRKIQNKTNLLSAHCATRLWFLRKTGKKLLKIKKKLQSINDAALHASYSTSSDQIIAYKQPDSPFFDRSKIHGFDKQVEKIEDRLVCGGNDIKTIGIVGKPGSGKTALAQMLFHSQRLKEMYSPMIWIQLSKDRKKSFFSKEAIARGIINCLTNDSGGDISDGNDLNVMLQNIYFYLLDTKYLIVLDNVMDPCDWYYDLGSHIEGAKDYSLLSHGLPRGSGGAIIVTSGHEDLAGKMVGEQNLHRVQPMSNTEICWSVFKDSMSVNVSEHETLLRMKDEIVDKCDGLPLAAKTLAEIIPIRLFEET